MPQTRIFENLIQNMPARAARKHFVKICRSAQNLPFRTMQHAPSAPSTHATPTPRRHVTQCSPPLRRARHVLARVLRTARHPSHASPCPLPSHRQTHPSRSSPLQPLTAATPRRRRRRRRRRRPHRTPPPASLWPVTCSSHLQGQSGGISQPLINAGDWRSRGWFEPSAAHLALVVGEHERRLDHVGQRRHLLRRARRRREAAS